MDKSKSLEELTVLYSRMTFQQFIEDHPKYAKLQRAKRLKKFNEYRKYGMNSQTGWFRDKQVMSVFKDIVLPNYQNSDVIQIASVGCARGEEPYSFLLKNMDNKNLRFDGYDTNPNNIKIAKSGVYKIFTHGFIGNLQQFKELNLKNPEKIYKIRRCLSNKYYHKISFSQETKKRINFATHDIMDEELPKKYDIALLLNVLMHYPEKGREKILKNIYESLNPNGWLMCERAYMPFVVLPDDHIEEKLEYTEWMRHIDRLGFEKQDIILSNYAIPDQTSFSQIYKKI